MNGGLIADNPDKVVILDAGAQYGKVRDYRFLTYHPNWRQQKYLLPVENVLYLEDYFHIIRAEP